ncbi:AI-2E family transporter [filamentous cyanobacterium CCP5]|nr:AI-2E family transporter [filamentous cyanobacterium CCP5]
MKFNQWLSLIVLAVCLYIVWQIRQVLLLALTAVVFATVLNRAVGFLERRWRSPGDRRKYHQVAVVVVTLGVLLGLLIFGGLIVPPFVNQLQELNRITPQVVERLRNWIDSLRAMLPASMLQGFQGLESLMQQLQSLQVGMLFGRFFALFSNTLTLTLNLLLVVAVTVMLLASPRSYRQLFMRAFPASARSRVATVLDGCENSITGWFTGILFNMTVIGLMSMVGLWILGVPLAFANGLLAGLLAFIPNLGPVISVIPPAAIALLDTPWKAIAVIGLYIVIQQVESNFLTPMVMRKQVSLLPAVTLLSQVTFAIFFGFLGLFLALPLTLIIQNWLEEFWVKGYLDQS